MGLLLGLHASPAVSFFHDGPKAPLGDEPPAIKQIVAIAPTVGVFMLGFAVERLGVAASPTITSDGLTRLHHF